MLSICLVLYLKNSCHAAKASSGGYKCASLELGCSQLEIEMQQTTHQTNGTPRTQLERQWWQILCPEEQTIVKEWQGRSLFDIIYLTQENKGPGAARNHGLEKSSGDLILFIDSDCEAHPKWIETIVSSYKDNDFDACGGPLDP